MRTACGASGSPYFRASCSRILLSSKPIQYSRIWFLFITYGIFLPFLRSLKSMYPKEQCDALHRQPLLSRTATIRPRGTTDTARGADPYHLAVHRVLAGQNPQALHLVFQIWRPTCRASAERESRRRISASWCATPTTQSQSSTLAGLFTLFGLMTISRTLEDGPSQRGQSPCRSGKLFCQAYETYRHLHPGNRRFLRARVESVPRANGAPGAGSG